MTEANKHALLSPSSAARWLVCVGALAMERGEPDDSNQYSDEGTCAHAVAAMCFTEQRPASAYVGRRIEVGTARTYEFGEGMVEPLQRFVDNVHEAVKAYELAGATVAMHVEQRVPVGHVTGEEGAEGTADVVLLATFPNGDLVVDVRDLKFGMGKRVYVDNNPQLMLYALGVLYKFDPLGEATRIRLVVDQPRISEAPSEWECTPEELRDFAHRAGMAGREALDVYNGECGSGPVGLRAGPHCAGTFCKARAKCPALAALVADEVGADFDVLEKPDATPPSIAAASLQEIGQKLRATDVIEDWIKQVRARAEALLFEHNNSPEAVSAMGFKLVEGKRGARAWLNAEDAEKALKGFRMKVEEMYNLSLISPTAAEKALAKESPRRWAKLQPLIVRNEGKPSVAPVQDKRPPLVLTPPADDFDEATGVEDLV